MSATAPRHYRLTQIQEPAPDWWEAEFHRRQERIRRRLPGLLRDFGRPATAAELRQTLASYSTAEVDHALGVLERLGLAAAERRVEPYSGPRSATVERVYYSLVED